MNKHDLNPKESSAGEIEGKVMVFVGDIPISISHLAIDAEKHGAKALIFKKIDNVCLTTILYSVDIYLWNLLTQNLLLL